MRVSFRVRPPDGPLCLFSLPRGVCALVALLVLCSAPLAAQDDGSVTLQPGDTNTTAEYQEQHGDLKFLKGRVEIATDEFVITADEANHNEATGAIEAKGNVRYRHLTRLEDIYAEKISYNADTEVGTFYQVHGIVESASQGGPRLLSTDNPFYIEGKVVYKAGDHYTIHDGYVTNCEVDDPWWTLRHAQDEDRTGRPCHDLPRRFSPQGYSAFLLPVLPQVTEASSSAERFSHAEHRQ